MPRSKKRKSKSQHKKTKKPKKVLQKIVPEDKRPSLLPEEEKDNKRYIELIDIIRSIQDNNEAVNIAFEELSKKLSPRIHRMISKFNIPGYSQDDIFQEALFALQFKAIKDYDITRGTTTGPAPFERFAILCIRRHLATEFKASYQNKKKVLNSSMSLDQEQPGSEEDLSLKSICPSDDPDILESLEQKESYKMIMSELIKSLSKFEKEVFMLYIQKNSYDDIAKIINEKRVKVKVKVKAIDNALSRSKQKSHDILKEFEKKYGGLWS